MIFLWIFAVIGLLATGRLAAFLLDYPSEGQPRSYLPECPDWPAPVPTRQVVVRSEAERDAQAVRDHQEVVEQYRGMIDELYDYGEDVVARSKDLE